MYSIVITEERRKKKEMLKPKITAYVKLLLESNTKRYIMMESFDDEKRSKIFRGELIFTPPSSAVNSNILYYRMRTNTNRPLMTIDGDEVCFPIYIDQKETVFQDSKFLKLKPDVQVDKISSFIEGIINIHKNLRFDKCDEAFYDSRNPNNQDNLDEMEIKIFGDYNPTPKCCVCEDKTKRVTDCGHSICIVCWENLEKKVCPLCRKKIKTFKQDCDCDDDDDESTDSE